MMNRNMNKQRGLLAAIMALVMVFAGVAVMATEADANEVDSGPLSFKGNVDYGDPYGTASNVTLGNLIDVAYDVGKKTYTVTGVFVKQTYNADETFSKLYGGNFGNDAYGIAFIASISDADTVQVGDGTVNTVPGDSEPCMLYLDGTEKTKTVKIGDVVYNIDLSKAAFIDATYSKTGDVGTYTLNSDVEITQALTFNGNTVINLNGHNLVVEVNSTDDKGLIALEVLGNLTIKGEGKLDIDVVAPNNDTKSVPSKLHNFELSTIGLYSSGTMNIEADVEADVNAGHTTDAKGSRSAAIVSSGAMTIGGTSATTDSFIVKAHGGNRGIHGNAILISSDASVYASGYERGVRSSGFLTVVGFLDADICNVNKGGNTGENDRHGIKVVTMTISEGAIVQTDSLRVAKSNNNNGTLTMTGGELDVVYKRYAGTGTPTGDYVNSEIAGLIVEGSVTISGDSKINVDAGYLIQTTIAHNSNSIQFNGVKADSDVTIGVGSVNISGSFIEDDTGSITITGNAVISGTVDVPITVISGATITVPVAGLVLNEDMTLMGSAIINVVGDLSGDADIKKNANNTETIEIIKAQNADINIDTPEYTTAAVTASASDLDSLKKAMEEANVVTLDSSVNTLAIGDGQVLTIPSHVTLYLNGRTIIVNTGGTLEVNGAHIYAGDVEDMSVSNGDRIVVKKNGNMYLDKADVRAPVDVKTDAYVSVKNALKMTVDGDATADLGVGYGNTLTLKDLTVPAGKSITAFGKVIIEGEVNISKNAKLMVYNGGSVEVAGTMNISGIADVQGKMTVKGTVKVYNADGNAVFNVQSEIDNVIMVSSSATSNTYYYKGSVTVDSSATFEVIKGRNGVVAENKLVIADDGSFTVKGTLKVTGTLQGKVSDKGTIEFNGKSVDSKIVIYDGVTLNLASVTGHMTVTDEKNVSTTSLTKPYYIQNGNTVNLWNVKGVTITETVKESIKDGTYKGDSDRVNVFLASMDVSGSISAVDVTDEKKVQITAIGDGALNEEVSVSRAYGTVSVGDVVVGEGVTLNLQDEKVTVSGAISVLAKNSVISVLGDEFVTVNGSITIGPESTSKNTENLKVNGVVYTITDITAGTTVYYTSFDSALAAIEIADEKEMTVLGSVTVKGTPTVPAGAELVVPTGATLSIDSAAILTIEDTALLSASDGTVSVGGMLVIIDKETGLDENTGKDSSGKPMFSYQVYTENGDTATYSGIIVALKEATSGDVITLKQDSTIDSSVTIPEGVTLVVPSNITLKIGSTSKDVTLTVDGVLDIQKNGKVDKTSSGSYKKLISLNGVINDAQGIANFATTFEMDDYVTFKMKVNGKEILVYSDLTYAAENVSYGTVTVFGDVSAGDVTFDSSDDAIAIQFATATTPGSISVGTLTLVGEEGVTITTTNGTMTGTVASAAGSMDLVKVTAMTIVTGIYEDVDGTTDLLYIAGTLTGKMTIDAGTVTMNDNVTVGTTKDDILTVSAEATLATAANTLTVKDSATSASVKQYTALVVDGTLSVVKGKLVVNALDSGKPAGTSDDGKASINGVLSISESGSNVSTIAGDMVVKGELIIDRSTDKAGKLNVTGDLKVGSAPSIGAAPSISGPIAIGEDNAKVTVYAGADDSAALFDPINGVTTAKYTDIKVNGVDYMRVYVDSTKTTVALKDTLPSYVKGYKVSGAEWTANGSSIDEKTYVGTYAAAEATLPVKEIGFTVSEGVGLQVYIDGLSPEGFYDVEKNENMIQLGTHTVTVEVESGYDGSKVTITVNGKTVANGGTFTLTTDDDSAVIIASGATPAVQEDTTIVVDKGDKDEGMGLTDILLIVLVVLIVIMAIIVALRMMRS